MKRVVFKDFDGDLCEALVNRNDSALPIIQEKIERNMPVETVDVENVKKAVLSFNVNFQRSLTPDEAKTLVETLKGFILKEIDKADKYYVSKSEVVRRNENGGKRK